MPKRQPGGASAGCHGSALHLLLRSGAHHQFLSTGADVTHGLHPGEHLPRRTLHASRHQGGRFGSVLHWGTNPHRRGQSHRVRLFWTNMMPAAVLQAALPKLLPPFPSLAAILHPYHVPTKPGHTDRLPFALHNQVGWERVCMPTVVSYLGSNAFRAKANGAPGEGQVFNI